jgi:predicted alpha/beta-hydrolase family hydrolase
MTIRRPIAKVFTVGSKTETSLSAILMKPRGARACFVFAHGAGAGMSHPFMEQIAAGLYGRGIATLRYQFPFMEKGGKRPDQPAIAHAAVRAAVAEARKRCRGLALIAGGKSFGGRMTSQAQPSSRSKAFGLSPSWASRCIRPESPQS